MNALDAIQLWLPVCAALAIWIERMREVAARRDTMPGTTRERVTFNLFMLCGLLSLGGGIAEYFSRGLRLWWPGLACGAGIAVASFVVRRAAIRALGKFWSLHVEMREGHEFVRGGPFARARHPVYFSMILELLGGALVLGSWLTFAVVLLIFIPTMIARVRIEEAALIGKFGDAYLAYKRATPAIVPRIFSRKEAA